MIKKVKLFKNDNKRSIFAASVIEERFVQNGFIISDDSFDLAVAVGGDGSFLRMVKENNFNSDIYYVGVNLGTLGFMQEVKFDEIDKFIEELKSNKYKVDKIGIEETVIKYRGGINELYSLNEVIIRDKKLKTVKLEVNIDSDRLEEFVGDGLLIATSSGSTAHNLSFGGSIVYNTFNSLQITPIAPLVSRVFNSLVNSVIIPAKKTVHITPINLENDLLVTVDGEHLFYEEVEDIEVVISDKYIKCLRFSHYNFFQKINEKLLTLEK